MALGTIGAIPLLPLPMDTDPGEKSEYTLSAEQVATMQAGKAGETYTVLTDTHMLLDEMELRYPIHEVEGTGRAKNWEGHYLGSMNAPYLQIKDEGGKYLRGIQTKALPYMEDIVVPGKGNFRVTVAKAGDNKISMLIQDLDSPEKKPKKDDGGEKKKETFKSKLKSDAPVKDTERVYEGDDVERNSSGITGIAKPNRGKSVKENSELTGTYSIPKSTTPESIASTGSITMVLGGQVTPIHFNERDLGRLFITGSKVGPLTVVNGKEDVYEITFYNTQGILKSIIEYVKANDDEKEAIRMGMEDAQEVAMQEAEGAAEYVAPEVSVVAERPDEKLPEKAGKPATKEKLKTATTEAAEALTGPRIDPALREGPGVPGEWTMVNPTMDDLYRGYISIRCTAFDGHTFTDILSDPVYAQDRAWLGSPGNQTRPVILKAPGGEVFSIVLKNIKGVIIGYVNKADTAGSDTGTIADAGEEPDFNTYKKPIAKGGKVLEGNGKHDFPHINVEGIEADISIMSYDPVLQNEDGSVYDNFFLSDDEETVGRNDLQQFGIRRQETRTTPTEVLIDVGRLTRKKGKVTTFDPEDYAEKVSDAGYYEAEYTSNGRDLLCVAMPRKGGGVEFSVVVVSAPGEAIAHEGEEVEGRDAYKDRKKKETEENIGEAWRKIRDESGEVIAQIPDKFATVQDWLDENIVGPLGENYPEWRKKIEEVLVRDRDDLDYDATVAEGTNYNMAERVENSKGEFAEIQLSKYTYNDLVDKYGHDGCIDRGLYPEKWTRDDYVKYLGTRTKDDRRGRRPVQIAEGQTIEYDENAKYTQEEFIQLIAPAVIEFAKAYDIPPSLTIAQFVLESRHGNSALCKSSYHFGNVKANITDRNLQETTPRPDAYWKGAVAFAYDKKENETDPYRTVIDPIGGIADKYRLFKDPRSSYLKHNKDLTVHDDIQTWIRAVMDGGYASDKAYIDKVLYLYNEYGLKKYDEIARSGGTIVNKIDGNDPVKKKPAPKKPAPKKPAPKKPAPKKPAPKKKPTPNKGKVLTPIPDADLTFEQRKAIILFQKEKRPKGASFGEDAGSEKVFKAMSFANQFSTSSDQYMMNHARLTYISGKKLRIVTDTGHYVDLDPKKFSNKSCTVQLGGRNYEVTYNLSGLNLVFTIN